ncbi:MAG: DUF2752 domain-containing protein [Clostridia bacterium]|nr:DUF2752 domain-containing protein [Clostridia bacterium]
MGSIRRNILIIYLGILIFGVAYILLSPLVFGSVGQPCPIYSLTGYLCPGCGATRMCLAVLRGDIIAALKYNLFLFVSSVLWTVISLFLFVGRPKFLCKKRFLYSCFILTMCFGIVFGILRNFS